MTDDTITLAVAEFLEGHGFTVAGLTDTQSPVWQLAVSDTKTDAVLRVDNSEIVAAISRRNSDGRVMVINIDVTDPSALDHLLELLGG
jgi:NAD(P)-dependent dehydrogenase (short-subunit alcohol dehydrogenase family)